MDVTTFLEPTVDLKRISAILDGLGHEGRCHTVRTWTKQHKEQVFEAARGFRPIDLDFLVPAGRGALEEVIHEGHNTLPVFSRFQKRFVKLEGGELPVGGYNHQSMEKLTGPGYFGVTKGDGEHEGELVIDYTKIPTEKPMSWPALRGNEGGLAGIVNGGMIDYLRAISEHVSIGIAFKHGQSRHQWFALVRLDPA